MIRGLATRLKRLEKQHRPRRVPRFIVFAIQADEAPGPVIGLSSLHRRVERLYGEDDWPAFAERARTALGGVMIATALYPAPTLPCAPAKAPAAPPEPTAPADPFALAGIGRVDDRYLGWHESNA